MMQTVLVLLYLPVAFAGGRRGHLRERLLDEVTNNCVDNADWFASRPLESCSAIASGGANLIETRCSFWVSADGISAIEACPVSCEPLCTGTTVSIESYSYSFDSTTATTIEEPDEGPVEEPGEEPVEEPGEEEPSLDEPGEEDPSLEVPDEEEPTPEEPVEEEPSFEEPSSCVDNSGWYATRPLESCSALADGGSDGGGDATLIEKRCATWVNVDGSSAMDACPVTCGKCASTEEPDQEELPSPGETDQEEPSPEESKKKKGGRGPR